MNNKAKIITLVCCFIFIALMFLLGIILNKKNNDGKFISEIPEINIKSEDIDKMNDEIEQLKNQKNYSDISYLINEDDTYLSTIVRYVDSSYIETQPSYISYTFDKKTGKKISEDELLKELNMSKEDILEKINKQFKKYYYAEDKEGYLDKRECDYEDCYLSFYRNITDLENSYVLGIEGKHVIAYISFDENSFSDDLEYFESINEDPHRVVIK